MVIVSMKNKPLLGIMNARSFLSHNFRPIDIFQLGPLKRALIEFVCLEAVITSKRLMDKYSDLMSIRNLENGSFCCPFRSRIFIQLCKCYRIPVVTFLSGISMIVRQIMVGGSPTRIPTISCLRQILQNHNGLYISRSIFESIS